MSRLKNVKKYSHPAGASGVEANLEGGVTFVGLNSLRVHVFFCPAEDLWYAQGHDVWLTAFGASEEAARCAFEKTLQSAIDASLSAYGNIEPLLMPIPPKAKAAKTLGGSYRLSYADLVDRAENLGFDNMVFYTEKQAAAGGT